MKSTEKEKGLIHIYHGDGKGKTTCAVGLAMRALGAGYHVVFAQFLKGGETSELAVLQSLQQLPEYSLDILRCEKNYPFTWLLKQEEKEALRADHNMLFQTVMAHCESEGKTLLVLDEMCATYELNLVDQAAVLAFLQHKPVQLEVIITGRNPLPELLEVADYISEIKKIKHPMDAGISARVGIEM